MTKDLYATYNHADMVVITCSSQGKFEFNEDSGVIFYPFGPELSLVKFIISIIS